jgi:uncharacterized membrane protein YfcA
MLVAAGAMLRRVSGTGERADQRDARAGAPRPRPVRVLGVGIGVGFLTGLFGVGGGFIIVPALVLLLGLPLPSAVGTSLVVIAITSIAGLVAHLGMGDIDLQLATTFTMANLIGAVGGGRLSAQVDEQRLARWFAYLVVGVAILILVEASTGRNIP